MKVGILGGGGISATHVRAAALIGGIRVVAVCGSNREKTESLAREANAVSFTDLTAFLSHPMDMVVIGSPSGLHADHAMAALGRGHHVLVEKPLDISTAKIDALIAEADRARRVVGVCFQERLAPEIVRLKSAVDEGRIGTPVFASGQVKWYRPPEYYRGSRWRGTWAFDGGGALMNQGIHTVDLLVWLFGPASAVTGRVANRLHPIEVEDTAAALIEFENGALGTIEVSTAAFPGFPRRIDLTGTAGSLTHEDEARPAALADATPHRRLLEDFIRAVRTGGTPACDAREGRRSVALVEAVYESARSGRRVIVRS